MKLSEQVVSLELAKKLKELGYPQESLWYWNSNGEIRRVDGFFDDDSKFIAVAPTVAELGEWLPVKWGELCLGCPNYSLFSIFRNMGDDMAPMWGIEISNEGRTPFVGKDGDTGEDKGI